MGYLIFIAILIAAMVILASSQAAPDRTEKVRIPLDASFKRHKNR